MCSRVTDNRLEGTFLSQCFLIVEFFCKSALKAPVTLRNEARREVLRVIHGGYVTKMLRPGDEGALLEYKNSTCVYAVLCVHKSRLRIQKSVSETLHLVRECPVKYFKEGILAHQEALLCGQFSKDVPH